MSYAALADFSPALAPPRRRRLVTRRRGMGASTAQIAGSAVTGGFDVAAAVLAATGVGAPFAGVVAAVGSVLGPVISMFSGCGQTCVQATQYANQAETALQQALSIYMSAPVHYYSAQQATMAQMQQVFNALQQACSNPALGTAGQKCISERLVKGGTAPWCPSPGKTGCDWITVFYDPVANDPNVVPDPSPVSDLTSSLSSALGGGSGVEFLMIGALVLGLVWAL